MRNLFRFVYRFAGALGSFAGWLYYQSQSLRHYAYQRGGGVSTRKH